MIEPCEEVKRVEQRYEKALDDMEKHYNGVLNKIRAEIETESYISKMEVLDIIDKYKAESEEECISKTT